MRQINLLIYIQKRNITLFITKKDIKRKDYLFYENKNNEVEFY